VSVDEPTSMATLSVINRKSQARAQLDAAARYPWWVATAYTNVGIFGDLPSGFCLRRVFANIDMAVPSPAPVRYLAFGQAAINDDLILHRVLSPWSQRAIAQSLTAGMADKAM
jgi:hypothetical protein